jgi:uncharacterized damage-inducible protein DinB
LKALFERFAAYNRWMNQRLYAAARQLCDEQRRADHGAYFKSIHGTLNHLVLSDRLWLTHWAAQGHVAALPAELQLPDVDDLGQELYPDFDSMHAAREALDACLVTACASWTAESLERESVEAWPDGVVIRRPLWQDVQHVFNHQAHHRGQLTTLLMQSGIDPGVTDIVTLPAYT